MCVTATVAAMLLAGIAASSSQDAGSVLAAQPGAVPQVGVIELDGYVFCALVGDDDDEGSVSSAWAAREMLEWRARQALDVRRMPRAIGGALGAVAVNCHPTPVGMAGMEAIAIEQLSEERTRVVFAIPAARLEAVSFSTPEVIACMTRRVQAREASTLEVLLLCELTAAGAGEEAAAAQLVAGLAATCGDGITATFRGAWVTPEGAPLAQGVLGWQAWTGRAIEAGAPFDALWNPVGVDLLATLESPEDAFRNLGTHANDSGLLERGRTLLMEVGFEKCAKALPAAAQAGPHARDHTGSQMRPAVRASVASGRAMLALLLSDGTCPLKLDAAPPEGYEEATVLFNDPDPAVKQKAAEVLAAQFEANPNVPSGVLLAMACTALNDPALGYPLARRCFEVSPNHPYAGATALLALRMMDRRDEAIALIERVRQVPTLDAWGTSTVDQVGRWCRGESIDPAATPAEPAEPAERAEPPGSTDPAKPAAPPEPAGSSEPLPPPPADPPAAHARM